MKKLFLIVWFSIIWISLSWCAITDMSNKDASDEVILELVQPERKLDIYWKILSMEWNEFTIQEVDISKDPTFGMEQEEKQAYMATLSDDQKIAMKEEIKNAILWNSKVIIPVWIPISVKEAQWTDAPNRMWNLEDITIWSYISVWYNLNFPDQKIAEYIKKSFTK